mgnify:CR=1 FL=1
MFHWRIDLIFTTEITFMRFRFLPNPLQLASLRHPYRLDRFKQLFTATFLSLNSMPHPNT